MYKFLAILVSPLLRIVQRNARIRNLVEQMLRLFPGLKLYLQAKLLYANTASASQSPALRMGAQQQRIYEELTHRIKARK